MGSIKMQGHSLKKYYVFFVALFVLLPTLVLARGLDDLDKAKTNKDIRGIRASLDGETRESLLGYVKNSSKDGKKRFIALASACKKMSDDESVDAVEGIFTKERDKDLRISCAIWMGDRKTNEKAKNALKKAFKSDKEDKAVRAALAIGLATMGDDSGKQVALDAILKSEYFADFGMLALERLKAKDVLPTLRNNRKNSSDYWVQNHCRIAELRIEMASASEAEKVNLLRAVLTEDGYFHARLWAGKRLGEMGGSLAKDALLSIVKNLNHPGAYGARKGFQIGVELGHWKSEELNEWREK